MEPWVSGLIDHCHFIVNPFTRASTRRKKGVLVKMTMRLLLVISALLLLAACGKVQTPPDIDTAAVREGYRFSGLGASAYFTSTKGCTYTDAYISASKTQVKEVKGSKTLYNYADISFSRYNVCMGKGFYISGSDSNASFSINRRLTTATLTATFEACRYNSSDDTSVCGPAELTMNWTGQGKLTRGRSTSQLKTPTFTVKEMFRGTSREATATGSFSFRGKTYELSSPGSSSEAFLFSGKGSRVLITK